MLGAVMSMGTAMGSHAGNDGAVAARGMRINSRLVGLLVAPLVVLISATGLGVAHGSLQSVQASELAERTAVASRAYQLVDALERERASLVASSTTTPDVRDAVRAEAESLAAVAARVGGPLQNETTAVLRRIRGLELLSSNDLGGWSALRAYSVTIDELLQLASRAINPSGAVDVAAASTVDHLARAQAASAQERDLVTILRYLDDVGAASFQELSSLASAQRMYAVSAASTAPPSIAPRIEQVSFGIAAADQLRRDAIDPSATPLFSSWISGLDSRTAELADLRSIAEARAVSEVAGLASSSRILLAASLFAMAVVLLISLLLLRRANRTIARPLQDLARQADDIAQRRLPEAVRAQQSLDGDEALHLPAVRATGAAEVHEVAAAFNKVQDTALRLAGEQASLRADQSEAMTNLGRRNQTLLARQLDFISSLESRETDPEFLDHLFKLDHLASRMRRNAESLLILAGSETPRRRRSPASVVEVVRAAMSEVEDFERVRIGSLADATVNGPQVIDLVHLLAELIENALNFSPPDTTVVIEGRPLAQGGYRFAVVDHGVGMTDVELLSANHRIRGLDELDGMPTRYLGQYVVAKLSAKTGAMVNLQKSAGGRGVTALVTVPTSALVGTPNRSAAGQPMPGSLAAREAGPPPFAPGAGLGSEAAPVDWFEGAGSQADHEPVGEVDLPQSWLPEVDADAGIGPTEPTVAPESEPVSEPETPPTGLWSDFLEDRGADASSSPDEPVRDVPPPVVSPAPLQNDWTPPVNVPSSAESGAASTRSGGLTVRVPGATLQSQQGESSGTVSDTPSRSADGVRSMLSQFQQGRLRGLTGANADEAVPPSHDPDQQGDLTERPVEPAADMGRPIQ